jgi:hypothetical protein
VTQSTEQHTINNILRTARTIAVVGLSDDPDKPSHEVAAFLQKHGYRIFPVNPSIAEVLGVKSYPDLMAISEPIDVVDIFRRSDAVPAIIDQAIQTGAKAVWMQKGVINPAAAEKAAQAGLQVVMDRCMMVELAKLMREGGITASALDATP